MAAHHTHDPICPLCEEKAKLADPVLRLWWGKLKVRFPDAHLSWTYRNAEEQERFFQDGKTLARYPHSLHNKQPARAMDLFQLRADNVAAWPRPWFMQIAAWLTGEGAPLEWAGDWMRFREFDHWQLKPGN